MSATSSLTGAANRDRSWHIVGRWQEYEGEAQPSAFS
jgi:hypothetical protein